MPRICEICGGIEEAREDDETIETTSALELLYVCDSCRHERHPSDE